MGFAGSYGATGIPSGSGPSGSLGLPPRTPAPAPASWQPAKLTAPSNLMAKLAVRGAPPSPPHALRECSMLRLCALRCRDDLSH